MSRLSHLTLLAVLMGGAGTANTLESKEIDTAPKEPVRPKGCKEYFFNAGGKFSTEQMRRSEVVFTCFASNDKNAKRKFDKFKSQ